MEEFENQIPINDPFDNPEYRATWEAEQRKLSRLQEMQAVVSTVKNAEEDYAIGSIDFDEYCHQIGRRIASLKIAKIVENGGWVDDDEYLKMIAEEKAKASLPTQEQINTANIDYLLMIQGEE